MVHSHINIYNKSLPPLPRLCRSTACRLWRVHCAHARTRSNNQDALVSVLMKLFRVVRARKQPKRQPPPVFIYYTHRIGKETQKTRTLTQNNVICVEVFSLLFLVRSVLSHDLDVCARACVRICGYTCAYGGPVSDVRSVYLNAWPIISCIICLNGARSLFVWRALTPASATTLFIHTTLADLRIGIVV